jgi:hypothetical protein
MLLRRHKVKEEEKEAPEKEVKKNVRSKSK